MSIARALPPLPVPLTTVTSSETRAEWYYPEKRDVFCGERGDGRVGTVPSQTSSTSSPRDDSSFAPSSSCSPYNSSMTSVPTILQTVRAEQLRVATAGLSSSSQSETTLNNDECASVPNHADGSGDPPDQSGGRRGLPEGSDNIGRSSSRPPSCGGDDGDDGDDDKGGFTPNDLSRRRGDGRTSGLEEPVVIEFPVKHFWRVAKQQNDIESSDIGHCRGFFYRLLIHPKGTAGTDSEASHLSVFLEAVRQEWFPDDWVFPNVRFELTVVNFRDPKQSVTSWAHWSFSNEATSRGWQKMLSHSRLSRLSGFMDEEGTVLIRGKAEPPYAQLWSRSPRYRPRQLWGLTASSPTPSSSNPAPNSTTLSGGGVFLNSSSAASPFSTMLGLGPVLPSTVSSAPTSIREAQSLLQVCDQVVPSLRTALHADFVSCFLLILYHLREFRREIFLWNTSLHSCGLSFSEPDTLRSVRRDSGVPSLEGNQTVIETLQATFAHIQLWPLATAAMKASFETSCVTDDTQQSVSVPVSNPHLNAMDWLRHQLAALASTCAEKSLSSQKKAALMYALAHQPSAKNVMKALCMHDVQKMDVLDPLPHIHTDLFTMIHRECQVAYVSHVYKQALLDAKRQSSPTQSQSVLDRLDDSCDAQEMDHALRVMFSTVASGSSREPLSNGDYATCFLRAKHVHSMYRALEQSGKKLKRFPEVLFVYLSQQRNTKKGELFDVPLRLEISNLLESDAWPGTGNGRSQTDDLIVSADSPPVVPKDGKKFMSTGESQDEKPFKREKQRRRLRKKQSRVVRSRRSGASLTDENSDTDDAETDDNTTTGTASGAANQVAANSARGSTFRPGWSSPPYRSAPASQVHQTPAQQQQQLSADTSGHEGVVPDTPPRSPSATGGGAVGGSTTTPPSRQDKWYCLFAVIIREGDSGGGGGGSQTIHTLLLRPEEDGPWFRIGHNRVEMLTPHVDFSEWKCHRDFFCAAAVYVAEDYIDAIANGEVDLEGDLRDLNPDLYEKTLMQLGLTEEKTLNYLRAGYEHTMRPSVPACQSSSSRNQRFTLRDLPSGWNNTSSSRAKAPKMTPVSRPSDSGLDTLKFEPKDVAVPSTQLTARPPQPTSGAPADFNNQFSQSIHPPTVSFPSSLLTRAEKDFQRYWTWPGATSSSLSTGKRPLAFLHASVLGLPSFSLSKARSGTLSAYKAGLLLHHHIYQARVAESIRYPQLSELKRVLAEMVGDRLALVTLDPTAIHNPQRGRNPRATVPAGYRFRTPSCSDVWPLLSSRSCRHTHPHRGHRCSSLSTGGGDRENLRWTATTPAGTPGCTSAVLDDDDICGGYRRRYRDSTVTAAGFPISRRRGCTLTGESDVTSSSIVPCTTARRRAHSADLEKRSIALVAHSITKQIRAHLDKEITTLAELLFRIQKDVNTYCVLHRSHVKGNAGSSLLRFSSVPKAGDSDTANDNKLTQQQQQQQQQPPTSPLADVDLYVDSWLEKIWMAAAVLVHKTKDVLNVDDLLAVQVLTDPDEDTARGLFASTVVAAAGVQPNGETTTYSAVSGDSRRRSATSPASRSKGPLFQDLYSYLGDARRGEDDWLATALLAEQEDVLFGEGSQMLVDPDYGYPPDTMALRYPRLAVPDIVCSAVACVVEARSVAEWLFLSGGTFRPGVASTSASACPSQAPPQPGDASSNNTTCNIGAKTCLPSPSSHVALAVNGTKRALESTSMSPVPSDGLQATELPHVPSFPGATPTPAVSAASPTQTFLPLPPSSSSLSSSLAPRPNSVATAIAQPTGQGKRRRSESDRCEDRDSTTLYNDFEPTRSFDRWCLKPEDMLTGTNVGAKNHRRLRDDASTPGQVDAVTKVITAKSFEDRNDDSFVVDQELAHAVDPDDFVSPTVAEELHQACIASFGQTAASSTAGLLPCMAGGGSAASDAAASLKNLVALDSVLGSVRLPVGLQQLVNLPRFVRISINIEADIRGLEGFACEQSPPARRILTARRGMSVGNLYGVLRLFLLQHGATVRPGSPLVDSFAAPSASAASIIASAAAGATKHKNYSDGPAELTTKQSSGKPKLVTTWKGTAADSFMLYALVPDPNPTRKGRHRFTYMQPDEMIDTYCDNKRKLIDPDAPDLIALVMHCPLESLAPCVPPTKKPTAIGRTTTASGRSTMVVSGGVRFPRPDDTAFPLLIFKWFDHQSLDLICMGAQVCDSRKRLEDYIVDWLLPLVRQHHFLPLLEGAGAQRDDISNYVVVEECHIRACQNVRRFNAAIKKINKRSGDVIIVQLKKDTTSPSSVIERLGTEVLKKLSQNTLVHATTSVFSDAALCAAAGSCTSGFLLEVDAASTLTRNSTHSVVSGSEKRRVRHPGDKTHAEGQKSTKKELSAGIDTAAYAAVFEAAVRRHDDEQASKSTTSAAAVASFAEPASSSSRPSKAGQNKKKKKTATMKTIIPANTKSRIKAQLQEERRRIAWKQQEDDDNSKSIEAVTTTTTPADALEAVDPAASATTGLAEEQEPDKKRSSSISSSGGSKTNETFFASQPTDAKTTRSSGTRPTMTNEDALLKMEKQQQDEEAATVGTTYQRLMSEKTVTKTTKGVQPSGEALPSDIVEEHEVLDGNEEATGNITVTKEFDTENDQASFVGADDAHHGSLVTSCDPSQQEAVSPAQARRTVSTAPTVTSLRSALVSNTASVPSVLELVRPELALGEHTVSAPNLSAENDSSGQAYPKIPVAAEAVLGTFPDGLALAMRKNLTFKYRGVTDDTNDPSSVSEPPPDAGLENLAALLSPACTVQKFVTEVITAAVDLLQSVPLQARLALPGAHYLSGTHSTSKKHAGSSAGEARVSNVAISTAYHIDRLFNDYLRDDKQNQQEIVREFRRLLIDAITRPVTLVDFCPAAYQARWSDPESDCKTTDHQNSVPQEYEDDVPDSESALFERSLSTRQLALLELFAALFLTSDLIGTRRGLHSLSLTLLGETIPAAFISSASSIARRGLSAAGHALMASTDPATVDIILQRCSALCSLCFLFYVLGSKQIVKLGDSQAGRRYFDMLMKKLSEWLRRLSLVAFAEFDWTASAASCRQQLLLRHSHWALVLILKDIVATRSSVTGTILSRETEAALALASLPFPPPERMSQSISSRSLVPPTKFATAAAAVAARSAAQGVRPPLPPLAPGTTLASRKAQGGTPAGVSTQRIAGGGGLEGRRKASWTAMAQSFVDDGGIPTDVSHGNVSPLPADLRDDSLSEEEPVMLHSTTHRGRRLAGDLGRHRHDDMGKKLRGASDRGAVNDRDLDDDDDEDIYDDLEDVGDDDYDDDEDAPIPARSSRQVLQRHDSKDRWPQQSHFSARSKHSASLLSIAAAVASSSGKLLVATATGSGSPGLWNDTETDRAASLYNRSEDRVNEMRYFLDRRTGRPRVSKDKPRVVHESRTWFVTYKPAFWHCSGPTHCVDRPLDLHRLKQGEIEKTLKNVSDSELQHSGRMESFHLWLMKQFPNQETIRRWTELECGLCHRIDLETSGAVLIARTRRARDFLWDQFRRRNVHKEYLLLCHGRVKNRFGVVKTRLLTKDYDSRSRIKSHFTQVVEEGGDDSLTEYHLCRVYRRKKWSDIIKGLLESPPVVGEYVLPCPSDPESDDGLPAGRGGTTTDTATTSKKDEQTQQQQQSGRGRETKTTKDTKSAQRSRSESLSSPDGAVAKSGRKLSFATQNRGKMWIDPALTGELTENDEFSLCKCRIVTGRTHQIRVHMRHIGHPLVSDTKYLEPKKCQEDRQWCPRMFLHAAVLEFADPDCPNTFVEALCPLAHELVQALDNALICVDDYEPISMEQYGIPKQPVEEAAPGSEKSARPAQAPKQTAALSDAELSKGKKS